MRVTFTVDHPNAFDPVTKQRIPNVRVEVSVLEKFLTEYPGATSVTFKELFEKFPIMGYLHNEDGPAIKSSTHRAYFKNGEMLRPGSDEFKEIQHKEAYKDNVKEILR